MLCGNKTDECPNCHKFIRRAVFAYHYENNCANLNETEPTKSNTSTRRSRLNLQQCQFCNYRYVLGEYETHKVQIDFDEKYCHQNIENIQRKRQIECVTSTETSGIDFDFIFMF